MERWFNWQLYNLWRQCLRHAITYVVYSMEDANLVLYNLNDPIKPLHSVIYFKVYLLFTYSVISWQFWKHATNTSSLSAKCQHCKLSLSNNFSGHDREYTLTIRLNTPETEMTDWILSPEVKSHCWYVWPKLIPPAISEMIGWVMGLHIMIGQILLFIHKDKRIVDWWF